VVYGYARCSTSERQQDVERQVEDLRRQGVAEIFQEYAKGTDLNRPQFIALQERIRPGDTIMATELSRLTRSVHQLCHLLEWAANAGCIIKVGSLTVDAKENPDPMIEGLVLLMGVFAQIERSMIVQRVKSGIKHAKNKGTKLGRPRISISTLPQIFLDHYPNFVAGQLTKTKLASLCNISRPTLNRYLLIMAEG